MTVPEHNMQFKLLTVVHSDVPTPGPFANGFANLLQSNLPQSGCLTRCYVSGAR